MRIAALLIALVGCQAGGGDDYPVTVGGDDHPIHPMTDAPPASDGPLGDGGMITGRVCLITDVRTPTTNCAATGAADITVRIGTATAMTADDGSFMLLAPSGSGLVWRTSAANLVSSVIPLTTSYVLPMVSTQTYLDLQNGNSVIVNSGEGSAFLYVRQAALPLAAATTSVTPVASYPSLGDRSNATNWVQGETGPLGVSWTPGIVAGTAKLTVTPPLAVGKDDFISVPIDDGAITFATLTFP